MPSRICLNMIVKNEEAIIERCLASAAPHIACYSIRDTGSSDATVEIIERFFAERGIPGEITHGTFVDFSQARNEALDAARASDLEFDYLLLCDADMELEILGAGFSDDLDAPVYAMNQYTSASLSYHNPRLLRRDVPGRYVGVTHEFLDAGTRPLPNFAGARFRDHAEGANRVEKFARDIQLLLGGLKAEPNNARYVFYLAQSYRDSQQWAKAYQHYERRIAMGGWDEEVWYARFQRARMTEMLGNEDFLVVDAYLKAFEDRPSRAEPLMHLARYLREHGKRHSLALIFAQRAIALPIPPDILFVDRATYTWRALDEYAIAAYWVGMYRESLDANNQLLRSSSLPETQRARVVANINYARDKLGLPPDLSAAVTSPS